MIGDLKKNLSSKIDVDLVERLLGHYKELKQKRILIYFSF
jgi:hypothetical protein